MLLIFLFLATFASAKAPEFSEQDRKYVREALREIGAVYGEVDARVPPCEGHRRTREAILRYEPHSSCVRARKIYESIYEGGRALQSACENLADYMTKSLESKTSCVSPNGKYKIEILRNLDFMKSESRKMIMHHFTDEIDDIKFDSEGSLPIPTGEFTNVKCALVPVIYLQYRKKELGLMNKHFGIADSEASDFCSDSSSYDPFYLEFLRFGEEGDPAKKQESTK
jgi:hypothetical protein